MIFNSDYLCDAGLTRGLDVLVKAIREDTDTDIGPILDEECKIVKAYYDLIAMADERISELEDNYNSEIDEARDEGETAGREAGYDSGYDSGFESGFEEGKDEGIEEGKKEARMKCPECFGTLDESLTCLDCRRDFELTIQ